MEVTYSLVIDSDLPKEYFKMINNIENKIIVAQSKYEDLIDYINMNQGSQYDQFQLSANFYEIIKERFKAPTNFNRPHLFTRYGSDILIQQENEDCDITKINLSANNSYQIVSGKIDSVLKSYDAHKYGIVLGWKIETSDGQTFETFEHLIENFKKASLSQK